MKIRVEKSQVNGEITVPGSKSHTIRAIAAAALAEGVSAIHSPLISEDTMSTANAVRALGVKVEMLAGQWRIHGNGGRFSYNGEVIDMGNSGTGLRIITALAATADFPVRFDGDESLRTRPMRQLLDALEKLGVKVTSGNGKCPLSVQGPITGSSTDVVGTSSQFLTALLFASPLAENDIEITVHCLNERPYVEITLGWLRRLGIEFECNENMSRFKVFGRQRYKPFEWTIPADFSTAAFPLIAAAVTGGQVRINNLDFNDLQGDKAVFDYMAAMGAVINRRENVTEVRGGALRAVQIDLNATPDALPAMAVAAACANGTTRLYNVPQARIKETDRIDCMTRELRKMGIQVVEFDDGMEITGGSLAGTELDGYGDHRIVMALSIAGLAADGVSVIRGAEAAAVTYPDFIEDFQRLGAMIRVE